MGIVPSEAQPSCSEPSWLEWKTLHRPRTGMRVTKSCYNQMWEWGSQNWSNHLWMWRGGPYDATLPCPTGAAWKIFQNITMQWTVQNKGGSGTLVWSHASVMQRKRIVYYAINCYSFVKIIPMLENVFFIGSYCPI